ncbi:MAG TPA: proton-conducting transporter membrane subunit [Stellaceae bacterium]|nr:proton-conducting transporter membrane subunit [Stellaceae bacterium]
MTLVPLPVALPLLVAALLLVFERPLEGQAVDAIAAATTAVCVLLAVRAAPQPLVYWFGGWQPHHGVAIGIAFTVDLAGASVAALSALLFTASFVFAWKYFDEVGARFHVLMLIFLAGISGFCLTGDLFNLFVFFELMSVAAFALTGYRLEASALEGALNFTVMNSLGSFLMLGGTALLYGRTGALNFAQIGRALAHGPDDALVAMAFVLLFSALFIKAAVVPFHFWLEDAHAVAPSPVCAIFSGIMVPLALFGAARLYWTMFAPMASVAAAAGNFLEPLGLATCLLGGIACLMQRHLKRLLAFSTIAHIGVMLAALALVSGPGLSAMLLYLCGQGLIKAALFLGAGILLAQCQGIDEIQLRGRGGGLPATGLLFAVGGLLLAGLPLGPMDSGWRLLETAAERGHHGLLPYGLAVGSALTGAAVLRATGRIFLGWGPDPGEEQQAPSAREQEKADRPVLLMLIPIAVLLVLAVLAGGDFADTIAARAAAAMADRPAYARLVLDGAGWAAAPAAVPEAGPLLAWMMVAGAAAVAGFELFRGHLPGVFVHAVDRLLTPLALAVERLHNGVIGDYAAWMLFGLTLFGGAFLFR